MAVDAWIHTNDPMAYIGSKSEEFKSLQWNASKHIRLGVVDS